MIFYANGRSRTIPFDVKNFAKLSVILLVFFLLAASSIISYNAVKLNNVKRTYSLAQQNISQDKRTTEQRLQMLEDFEEKISFFLSGALSEGENKEGTIDYTKAMGGGEENDAETFGSVGYEVQASQNIFSLPPKTKGDSSEEERVGRLKSRLQELADLALKEKKRLDFTPSILPSPGYVTSGFGWRISPFTGNRHLHRGLDLVNKIGTPVMATAAGKVIFAGKEVFWGKAIFIEHRDGIITKFGHLNSISVTVGQNVERGQIIGEIGMSGRTTGPHLHYQIEIGEKAVDPMLFVIEDYSYN